MQDSRRRELFRRTILFTITKQKKKRPPAARRLDERTRPRRHIIVYRRQRQNSLVKSSQILIVVEQIGRETVKRIEVVCDRKISDRQPAADQKAAVGLPECLRPNGEIFSRHGPRDRLV